MTKMEFGAWFDELKRIALSTYGFSQEAVGTFDAEAYRNSYYDAGYSPSEAIQEDLTCA